jgi:hypothetical protein
MSMALSAPARTETLPALASVPSLSGSLAYYVGGDTVIDGDLHPVQGSPGPGDVAEARRVLPQVQHLCRPPSIALIAAWCRKISPHLPRAPLDEQAVLVAVQGFAVACCDLPYAVWTGESATEALRTYKWWPTPAEVLALLRPYGARYTRLRDRLTAIIAAADRATAPPRKPQDPTPEAVEHVAAVVSAFVAERGFNDPAHADGRKPPRARTLAPGHLLAVYEAWAASGQPGADAAAQRAALIRSEMIWAK